MVENVGADGADDREYEGGRQGTGVDDKECGGGQQGTRGWTIENVRADKTSDEHI